MRSTPIFWHAPRRACWTGWSRSAPSSTRRGHTAKRPARSTDSRRRGGYGPALLAKYASMSLPSSQLSPILSVRHLKVYFQPRGILPWQRKGEIRAVDDLHLDLRAGETLGIVGESGCGKSSLARALIGLETPTSGSIRYAGRELANLSKKDWRPLRRELQMVFQD